MSELEKYKPKKWEALICLLLFALWTLPVPILIEKIEVRILEIPLLWFYYISLSVLTALIVTLMYLFESRGEQYASRSFHNVIRDTSLSSNRLSRS